MDDANDIDLLEQYLRGELSEQAIAKLESRLEKESILARQLVEIKEVQNGIRYARLESQLAEIRAWEIGEEEISGIEPVFEEDVSDMIRVEKNRELLAEIQSFEKVETEKEVVMHSIGRYWWGVAAGVLLLLGVAMYLFQPAEELSNEELFAMYFELYPHPFSQRGELDLDLAFVYYDRGDYNAFINKIEDVELSQISPIQQFYLAIAYIASNQEEKALPILNNLLENLPNFSNQINWYIGLCHLQLNNREESEKYLQKVKPFKQADVTSLLNALKQEN